MTRLILSIIACLSTSSLQAQETVLGQIASNANQRPRENAIFGLDGKTATLTKLDHLPLVQNEFSERYTFDVSTNPKLKLLRERYNLDEVIASGKEELDRQVALMEWTHEQLKKFGRPSCKAQGGLEVLRTINDGETFFCKQYAEVFVSAAASLGWVARPLALRRHEGVAAVGGSTEHSTTEIWSNQFRKWVMLDPTSNLYLEKNGVPLNAFEIRQEWFYRDGVDLDFVVGTKRRKYKKAELPIFLKKFDGFGDLAFHPDELDKYGFIGYIPNTNLMDAAYDYGKMFIVKDELCDKTQWHTRDAPKNPAVDPYFPIGQARLRLTAVGNKIRVDLNTFTPNFERFEVRQDGSDWISVKKQFTWDVGLGTNRLEARTINKFAVAGPSSIAEVEVAEGKVK